MGKGQWKRNAMRIYGGNNNMPFKKKPEELGTLADQINQKLYATIQESKNIESEYAVDFTSKTFGDIKLKFINRKDKEYLPKDIENFFKALDYVGIIMVSIKKDERGRDRLDDDSIFTVTLKPNVYTLPNSLFWPCLPSNVRNKFNPERGFLKGYQALFASYGRRLVPQNI